MSAANAFEREIHRRLLAGDRAASTELAEAYLTPVRDRLRRRVRGVRDETQIEDAVTDALLNYIEHPEKYNPECLDLQSYLVMSAHRDLLNTLARDKRRHAWLQSLDTVEHLDLAGNTGQEGMEVKIINRLSVQDDTEAQELLRRLLTIFSDQRDWEMLQLIAEGERKTEPFARILGVEDRPIAEQRAIVKKHKDRIKARLKRLGVRSRGR